MQVVRGDERVDASSDVAMVDAAVVDDAGPPRSSPALAHAIGGWPCSRFDHHNAAVLALMHRFGDEHSRVPGSPGIEERYEDEARLSALAQCQRTSRGAWAAVLDPEHTFLGFAQWQLHHIDEEGHDVHYVERVVTPTGPRSEVWFQEQGHVPRRQYDVSEFVTLFDFDGDGEDEIVFAHGGESEQGEGAALWVFRYAGGRVTRLARVANALGMTDVDGDGRPDAVAVHRRLVMTPAEYHSTPVHHPCVDDVRAPMTVARSLPGGTFSVSDPAVRAYNRRECHARPSTIVARDANGAVDEVTTAHNVVCAGVWGVRRATIEAALRTCDELVTEDDCETVVRNPSGCRHRALLLQWTAEFP